MGNYALITNGIVMNTVVWDGETAVDFGEDYNLVVIPDGVFVTIGYLYADGVFSAPPLTSEELAQNELNAIAANVSKKNSLMDEASQQISVLQDAVDLNMATDDEARLLPLWKKYRVLLNRIIIDVSGEIQWPARPI